MFPAFYSFIKFFYEVKLQDTQEIPEIPIVVDKINFEVNNKIPTLEMLRFRLQNGHLKLNRLAWMLFERPT